MDADSFDRTPYERFASIALRVLAREPDGPTASQLGQSVAYVLDSSHRTAELHELVADLESARVDAKRGKIAPGWALPLTTALGVVRQHVHNHGVREETTDPGSRRLRERVLVTLKSGVDTPSAIAKAIDSPPTVISRVLSQLTKEDLVGFEQGQLPDKRIRRYYLVPEPAPTTADSGSPRTGFHGVVAEPVDDVMSLSDPDGMINFARQQIQVNPTTCKAMQPGLQRMGMDPSLPAATRVRALSTAIVISRSVPSWDPQECLALAELIQEVARLDDAPLVKARATYEEVRAILMDSSSSCADCIPHLDEANATIADDKSPAADVMRGWIAHAKSLIHSRTDAEAALEHSGAAVEQFQSAATAMRDTLPAYGESGALVVRAREQLRLLRSGSAYRDAKKALEMANTNTFVRVMAEANLWAGEAALDCDRAEAPRYLEAAAQQFTGLKLDTWRLFAESSLAVYDLDPERLCRNYPEWKQRRHSQTPHTADKVIEKLEATAAELEKQGTADMFWSTNWAKACVTRRTGVVARWDGDPKLAKKLFERSIAIYEQLGDSAGMAMAILGVTAVNLDISQIGVAVDHAIALGVQGWVDRHAVGDLNNINDFLKRLIENPWLELDAPV